MADWKIVTRDDGDWLEWGNRAIRVSEISGCCPYGGMRPGVNVTVRDNEGSPHTHIFIDTKKPVELFNVIKEKNDNPILHK